MFHTPRCGPWSPLLACLSKQFLCVEVMCRWICLDLEKASTKCMLFDDTGLQHFSQTYKQNWVTEQDSKKCFCDQKRKEKKAPPPPQCFTWYNKGCTNLWIVTDRDREEKERGGRVGGGVCAEREKERGTLEVEFLGQQHLYNRSFSLEFVFCGNWNILQLRIALLSCHWWTRPSHCSPQPKESPYSGHRSGRKFWMHEHFPF